MTPDELENILKFEPFVPLRVTMSSGHQIAIEDPTMVTFIGLCVSIQDFGLFGQPRLRFVSVPNIAMVGPVPRQPKGGRHVGDEE